MHDIFRKLASRTSNIAGNPWTFFLAITAVVVWACSGPLFGFSDTWQLVINTSTTIITFLMVFLIQNTQNRESMAMHIKLDELVRGVKGARNSVVSVEDMSDDELATLKDEFRQLHEKYADTLAKRKEKRTRTSK